MQLTSDMLYIQSFFPSLLSALLLCFVLFCFLVILGSALYKSLPHCS